MIACSFHFSIGLWFLPSLPSIEDVRAQDMMKGIHFLISWRIFLFIFRGGGSDTYKGWTIKWIARAVIYFCQRISIRSHKWNLKKMVINVPVNKDLLTGPHPVNKELLTGTFRSITSSKLEFIKKNWLNFFLTEVFFYPKYLCWQKIFSDHIFLS